MTRDIQVLITWTRVVLIIAAVCTTAVPIIYSRTPWRSRILGKLFMQQAISLAVAMDLSVLFTFWRPADILIRFWINAIVLTAIAGSTSSLALYIWRLNHPKKELKMLLNDQLYQLMKRIVQVGLPGFGALYFTLAQIWGLPAAEQIVGTTSAIALFLGLLLGFSSKTYNESEERFDGTLIVEEGETGSTLRLKQLDPNSVLDKDEITFKVEKPTVGEHRV